MTTRYTPFSVRSGTAQEVGVCVYGFPIARSAENAPENA
jgi:hypothetical protein